LKLKKAGFLVVLLALAAATVGAVPPSAHADPADYPMTLFPSGHASPFSIAPGPDGALWFTFSNATEFGNAIGRIDTAGNVQRFELPNPGSQPGYITAGPDGALWFTEVNEQTGDRVGRMTTDGTVTDELPIVTSEVECSPTGITAGPDGNVWFTCELADQIGRITVPKPVPPGPAPVPVAVTAEPRFTG